MCIRDSHKTSRRFLSYFLVVQVSDPYVHMLQMKQFMNFFLVSKFTVLKVMFEIAPFAYLILLFTSHVNLPSDVLQLPKYLEVWTFTGFPPSRNILAFCFPFLELLNSAFHFHDSCFFLAYCHVHLSFRIVFMWWTAFSSSSSLFLKSAMTSEKVMVLLHSPLIIIQLLLVSMNPFIYSTQVEQ